MFQNILLHKTNVPVAWNCMQEMLLTLAVMQGPNDIYQPRRRSKSEMWPRLDLISRLSQELVADLEGVRTVKLSSARSWTWEWKLLGTDAKKFRIICIPISEPVARPSQSELNSRYGHRLKTGLADWFSFRKKVKFVNNESSVGNRSDIFDFENDCKMYDFRSWARCNFLRFLK